MKITGFTIVRNAIKFDYPVVESITSILPICNEFIVSVGNSDDNTRELIESIKSEKIKIMESVWNDALRKGGAVLAEETNKAFQQISDDTDWAFYIQADEVVHENDLDIIYDSAKKYLNNKEVEGLLFKYRHFYGSYDYVADSYRWYRHEIRIIRNDKNIFSYRDAQGFRKKPNRKLRVKLIDAYINHYGWVRPPDKMQQKIVSFHKLYHDDEWIEKNVIKTDGFDYSKIDSLTLYNGTHPSVMIDRINRKNWYFEHDISYKNFNFKNRIRRFIENLTGYRIGEYKNYILLKD